MGGNVNLNQQQLLQGETALSQEQLREKLAQMEAEFAARRQQLIDQANQPPDGKGFGHVELGLQVALAVEQALAREEVDPESLVGWELVISVPPGSDLTPLFNTRSGELVIRVRQYTPAPLSADEAFRGGTHPPIGGFPIPEL